MFKLDQFVAACATNDKAEVRSLIQSGIDISANGSRGKNGLHKASENGRREVVKMLFDANVDLDVQDKHGRTALHHACIRGRDSIAKMLILRGADVNIQDDEGLNSLHHASIRARVKITKLLIENGVDVNVVDKQQYGAFYHACLGGHEKIMRLLVGAKGFDITKQNAHESDVLRWAYNYRKKAIISILVDAGIGTGINLQGNFGTYALSFARQWKHQKLIQALIDAGCNISEDDLQDELVRESLCQNNKKRALAESALKEVEKFTQIVEKEEVLDFLFLRPSKYAGIQHA